MNHYIYRDLIYVFIITALFDFAMNILPPPLGAKLLKTYFKQHTILAAALIAGFVGAITLIPIQILTQYKYPTLYNCFIICIVSAFIGFPMEYSNIFPHLTHYYYNILPRYQSFLADGLSGFMVATVFWIITIGLNKPSKLFILIPIWTIILVIYYMLYIFNIIVT